MNTQNTIIGVAVGGLVAFSAMAFFSTPETGKRASGDVDWSDTDGRSNSGESTFNRERERADAMNQYVAKLNSSQRRESGSMDSTRLLLSGEGTAFDMGNAGIEEKSKKTTLEGTKDLTLAQMAELSTHGEGVASAGQGIAAKNAELKKADDKTPPAKTRGGVLGKIDQLKRAFGGGGGSGGGGGQGGGEKGFLAGFSDFANFGNKAGKKGSAGGRNSSEGHEENRMSTKERRSHFSQTSGHGSGHDEGYGPGYKDVGKLNPFAKNERGAQTGTGGMNVFGGGGDDLSGDTVANNAPQEAGDQPAKATAGPANPGGEGGDGGGEGGQEEDLPPSEEAPVGRTDPAAPGEFTSWSRCFTANPDTYKSVCGENKALFDERNDPNTRRDRANPGDYPDYQTCLSANKANAEMVCGSEGWFNAINERGDDAVEEEAEVLDAEKEEKKPTLTLAGKPEELCKTGDKCLLAHDTGNTFYRVESCPNTTTKKYRMVTTNYPNVGDKACYETKTNDPIRYKDIYRLNPDASNKVITYVPVGNSRDCKTGRLGTYTRGPVIGHYYCLDGVN